MQKILRFEIAVAMKDRPKAFRFITCLLFSFCVTIIVISSLSHLLPTNSNARAQEGNQKSHYASFVAAPVRHLLDLKK